MTEEEILAVLSEDEPEDKEPITCTGGITLSAFTGRF